jgi:hypothetical protein
MPCAKGCCESAVVHWRSIAFASKLPEFNKDDSNLDRDRDAYKRLRAQGMQPRGIDDCRHLENEANDRWEVEHHHILGGPKVRAAVREAEEKSREYEQMLKEVSA